MDISVLRPLTPLVFVILIQNYRISLPRKTSMVYYSLVNYLVSKILGKILGTEMLVDLENLGTR